MASTRVRFSPGFPPGAGFPGEHVFREFSGAPAVIVTTLNSLTSLSRISLEQDFTESIFSRIF
jgi:hypothetical protein